MDTNPSAAISATIQLPVPGLVVLIGAAGAGKSTFAARLFTPDEVLSSDELRAVLSGDASDQRATRTVFGILHREVTTRLASGRLVVVDATNVERSARLALVRLAGAAGVPAIAIALVPDDAEVHARNRRRPGRFAPPEIVDRHLAALRRVGSAAADLSAALAAEGFAARHVLGSAAAIDGVIAVERLRAPSRPVTSAIDLA